MNTPPAKAGGFELRLKARLIGTSADGCRYTVYRIIPDEQENLEQTMIELADK